MSNPEHGTPPFFMKDLEPITPEALRKRYFELAGELAKITGQHVKLRGEQESVRSAPIAPQTPAVVAKLREQEIRLLQAELAVQSDLSD
ncbi:MAG TPA: hypothetical protein VH253_06330 [Phycisphaerae bacterium]|nr:hypothetical protein [Phycisphaerae bacterium]